MSAAAAAARGGVDEDSTMFFPGPNSVGGGPDGLSQRPGDVGVVDSPGGSPYDAPTAFSPVDDVKPAAAPALLAAKSEPLGGSRGRPPGRARNNNRPTKAAPGAKGSEAAARAAKSPSAANRRKPKEPSTILLGLGLGVVVLAGIAAAYFLTRGDGENGVVTDEATPAVVEEEPVDPTESTVAPDGESTAGPEAVSDPVVEFDQAAIGPISASEEYTLNVNGGPEGATYQLLVDGTPAAEPAAQIPAVTFEPGRHLLEVKITSTDGETNTPPVVVYAVGEIPTAVEYRANLASVNVDPNIEGWAEAVRQFDAFVGTGHEQLRLMPSDWFPGLSPGYWNLYVPFASEAEAVAYCESFGLAMPDDCFSIELDPSAAAGG